MYKKINDSVKILVICLAMLSAAFFASAQEDKTAVPALEMTRADMIQQIKDEISYNEDILTQMPELKKVKGEGGREDYLYSDGKETINIEDLDADRLGRLLDKVTIQVNAYEANMVARQMDAIREAQRVSAMQQQMPRTPPSPPQTPPSPPSRPPRR